MRRRGGPQPRWRVVPMVLLALPVALAVLAGVTVGDGEGHRAGAAPTPPPAPGGGGHAAPLPDRSPTLSVPAAFLPDPLRPVPEEDFTLLREEEAPKTSTPPPSRELAELIAEGRDLFFSTTAFNQRPSRGPLVFGQRLSCATCHSGPAFTDNRSHPIGPTDERQLVPRQTPHLFGMERTAPFGWDGRNENLEEQARGAIVSDLEMNGTEPTRAQLRALAAFVESLEPPPARPGIDFDPVAAARGEVLFREERGVDPSGEFSLNVKISCETCHLGVDFTDNKPHRILALFGDPADPGHVDEQGLIRGFDTPPLHALRFTPPYFHDGLAGDPTGANLAFGPSAARRALRDNVLNFYNLRFAFNFTPQELDDLTEFLLSL